MRIEGKLRGVTQKQIEFFLGCDNLEKKCLAELEALANGSYKTQQFKKDVLSHWEDAIYNGDIEIVDCETYFDPNDKNEKEGK
jgi:hypothetical protein